MYMCTYIEYMYVYMYMYMCVNVYIYIYIYAYIHITLIHVMTRGCRMTVFASAYVHAADAFLSISIAISCPLCRYNRLPILLPVVCRCACHHVPIALSIVCRSADASVCRYIRANTGKWVVCNRLR